MKRLQTATIIVLVLLSSTLVEAGANDPGLVGSLTLAAGPPLAESSRSAALCSAIAMSEAGSQVRTYDVTVPDEWKSMLSVGKLSVVGSPFYGVPWHRGLTPCVRLNLPLKNLTTDRLYVFITYRSEPKTNKRGYSNMESGAQYTLGPGEERLVETIAPIASVKIPVRFLLRMWDVHAGPPGRKPSESYKVVLTIDPLPVSGPHLPAGNVQMTEGASEHFAVKDVRLTHSKEQGNVFLAQVLNTTSKNLPLGIYVALNDPRETKKRARRESGGFCESVTIVSAKSEASIRLPYRIPSSVRDPLLVFTLFKPREEYASYGKYDKRRWDVQLVCWGSVDLRQAAERGDSVIPVFVPVEERAKLTAEAKSEHFVIHYRPGSYAEQELSKIIKQREGVYGRLSSALNMELPKRVRIDLYPDMEAKGLGSGTRSTPANTVTDFHIAELYNHTYQCDPNHELAHIFACQFPGHPALGDTYGIPGCGLLEGFAEYSEAGGPGLVETVRKKAQQGHLPPALSELLISSSYPAPEHLALVDFLLNKDVEKFKTFYVRVLGQPTVESVQDAAKAVYGKSLKVLEKEWHAYLKAD